MKPTICEVLEQLNIFDKQILAVHSPNAMFLLAYLIKKMFINLIILSNPELYLFINLLIIYQKG